MAQLDQDMDLLPEQFNFINKELSGTKLTSKLLIELLHKEEKRKVLLEARAHELNQFTRVDISRQVKDISDSIKASLSQTAELREEITRLTREKLPDKSEDAGIYLKLERIDELEKSRDYILLVNFVMFVSTRINTCLREGNPSEAIIMFNQLRSLQNIILEKSDAANISKYCSGVLKVWEGELHGRIIKELGIGLEAMGWPTRIDTRNPSEDIIKKFQSTVRCLSKLTGTGKSGQESGVPRPVILIDYKESSSLVNLLVNPLRKRFRYHFCSSKLTADDTKPEWYFAQVKHWIRDLVPFLINYVEDARLEECGCSTILEFVQELSQFLVLKTDALLADESTTHVDVVFSKILEESIRYDAEIKSRLEEWKVTGKDEIPGFVNTIFSQPHVLNRWITIEKRGSLDKLDILFTSASAWNRVLVPGPTEIAELFLMMLRFLVDRFAHLVQPGQKIQFVQLLIEILDDFRIRCIQVWTSKSEVENISLLVAETLGYVHGVLEEWEDSPFFTNLDFFWETIRAIEKEDLEERKPSRRRTSAGVSSISPASERPKRGLFTQVQERYASSQETVLMSILQK